MLLNKYLPEFDFRERHSTKIFAKPEVIASFVERLDMRQSRIIRFLFRLRGMPSDMTGKAGFEKSRFIELERIENKEVIIGLIGQFWKPNGNLQLFCPEEFRKFSIDDFLKAVWNFEIIQLQDYCLLETETRIQCLGKNAKRRFSRYWFFIRPFSGLIRKEILKSIKRNAEMAAHA